MSKKVETLRWVGDESGHLVLIDQTRLPTELLEIECRTVEAVWEAIKQLRVRGAPAIGIAAAYGVVVGLQAGSNLDVITAYLASSRPTAVNLFWALERMKKAALRKRDLLAEARAIHEEDRAMCHAIGRYGAEQIGRAHV